MRKFTEDHEWIEVIEEDATIGITDYAQEQLGDVVHVDLPDVGKELSQKDEIAVVESVKAASEVYAPISGTVTDVNSDLEGNPGLINDDAESDGWFVKIKISDMSDLDGLMDLDAYRDYIGGL